MTLQEYDKRKRLLREQKLEPDDYELELKKLEAEFQNERTRTKFTV